MLVVFHKEADKSTPGLMISNTCNIPQNEIIDKISNEVVYGIG
jgi:hypothetical protein